MSVTRYTSSRTRTRAGLGRQAVDRHLQEIFHARARRWIVMPAGEDDHHDATDHRSEEDGGAEPDHRLAPGRHRFAGTIVLRKIGAHPIRFPAVGDVIVVNRAGFAGGSNF